MSKTTALVLTPLVGLLVVLGTVSQRNAEEPARVASLGLAVTLIVLAAHWSAVKRAAPR